MEFCLYILLELLLSSGTLQKKNGVPLINRKEDLSMADTVFVAVLGIVCISVNLNDDAPQVWVMDDILIEKDQIFPGTELIFSLPEAKSHLVHFLLKIYFKNKVGVELYPINDRRLQAGMLTGAMLLK